MQVLGTIMLYLFHQLQVVNSDGTEVDWTDYVDLDHWNEDGSSQYGGTDKH